MIQPDIWYSYRDNQDPPQGTPCIDAYDGGSLRRRPQIFCSQFFPELFTGGVGPHGATA